MQATLSTSAVQPRFRIVSPFRSSSLHSLHSEHYINTNFEYNNHLSPVQAAHFHLTTSKEFHVTSKMEEPQNNALTATFPTPPPFYQYFTPENISRIAELRAQETQSHSENTNATIRILDLPAELRYLQPPEPPSDRRYRCFGDVYNVCFTSPSLVITGGVLSQGREKKADSVDS